jgi:hypothetical protein
VLALVVAGVALSTLSQGSAHTLHLLLRTVRDAADRPSLAMGALLGFTAVALAVLGVARRNRPALIVGLPAFTMGGALLVGHSEATLVASRATTALTMAQRGDLLALAVVRGSAFFALGALATGILLGGAAVASSRRTSAPARLADGRVGTLAAGLLTLVAVALTLHHHREAWLGALPAALGVLAIFLGTRELASPTPAVRRVAAARVVRALMLGVAAVAAVAAARGFVMVVGLGDDDAGDLAALLASQGPRFRGAAGLVAAFVLPVAAASLVAFRRADVLTLPALGRAAASAATTLALVALAFVAVRGSADALGALRPVLTPASMVLPRIGFGDDCASLEEDRVVYLGKDRVRVGDVDVGPSAALDDLAGCASFAVGHVPASATGAWLAVEESATFGRAGCLLEALAALRGEAVSPGTFAPLHPNPAPIHGPCTASILARDEEGTAPSCGAFLLPHPFCAFGRPDPGEVRTADDLLEVVMIPGAFAIRPMRGHATLSERIVPRKLTMDARGRVGFDDLAREVRTEWMNYGGHRDPMDYKLDVAVVRAPRDAPVVEVLAVVEAIRSVQRPRYFAPDVVNVSALDVALALAD